MFRHAILTILSLAALSAAAQAATPCATLGKAGRQHAAVAVSTLAARPRASKSARPSTAIRAKRNPDRKAYARAEALLVRALANRQARARRGAPPHAHHGKQPGGVYTAQRRFSEAEPLYHRSLEASEHAFGNGHPVTVATIKGLASLYEAQGRRAEAALLLPAHRHMAGPARHNG